MTEKRVKLASIDARPSVCRSCGAPVRWGRTPNGRHMILEADAELAEDGTVPASMTHWANCPSADEHRRKAVRT